MRELAISTGRSCYAKVWKNGTVQWPDLCGKLETTVRTKETVEEYHKMKKADKDTAKDKGGFVGGQLRDNRRKVETVDFRSMLTLDADHAKAGFIEKFIEGCRYAACLYTTHGHTPEAPRCRILVPVKRDMTSDEYAAIARYFADEWGIDQFDVCSYKVNQLMYWPTTPKDGEYICRVIEKEWLDPDAYLAAHPNWRNCAELPTSSRETAVRETQKKHLEDPLGKTGFVGDFCRAYSIQKAIDVFLADRYASTDSADRYDYIPGEGACGVVVYDDKFVYSHHATDPAGGKLLNAFDLVRIHLFGNDDEQLSYKNMCELVAADSEVQEMIAAERQSEAKEDFAPDTSGWDDPVPLSSSTLPDFPVDALTPVLRDYAMAVAETTQTAVDMAAVGTLTTVSACMRNLYKVEGKADWREPTNIYGVIIADPSERKSANIALDTKPVDEYVREYNEAHKVEFEMSRATKQRLENKKNSLISASRKKGADDSAEDFNDALQNVVEQLVHFQEKKPMRVYVDDTTPEKLVETLAENNNAISIISSEGGIFDVLSGTYSSKVNIDVFLKAYSGEHIAVDRIMRNSISVDDACLTILLSVQPVVIGDLMKNSKFRHRGLTARFLYTHPRSLVGNRSFQTKPIPPETYQNYKTIIYNILDEKRGVAAEIIYLTEEAKPILKEYYDWVEKCLVDELSFYSDWIGKLVGNTLRIAGILARTTVIRRNVGDALLEEDAPITISAEIMENAIRIGKYFLAHAVRAYSTMGVYSDFQTLGKALDKIVEKGLHTICRRDLMRICRWLSSADEAQEVLSSLEDYGYLRLISIDNADKLRGGRPKNPTYAVNPKIFNA